MELKTHKGQNVLTSMFIIVFVLFLVIIPINMLIDGVRLQYTMPNAKNFTFSSQAKINETITDMASTLRSTESQELGIVTIVATVVNGAINALRVLLMGTSSIFAIFDDFFNAPPLDEVGGWLKPAVIGLASVVVMFAVISAYLRWKP